MPCDVKSDRLFLVGKQHILGPFLDIGKMAIGMTVLGHDLFGAEQRLLPRCLLALDFLAVLHGFFEGSHKLGSFVLQGIKRATLDQGLGDPFVDSTQIDPLAEIVQRFEFTASFAGFDNCLYRTAADPFDSSQAKTDVFLMNCEISA